MDISRLSPDELDALIAHAIARRAQVGAQDPPRPLHPPAIVNPRWYATPTAAGTLFQVQQPGLGWLAYLLPPHERALLAEVLQQHAQGK